jgi:DNA-binding NtrC family response regulator
MRVDHVRIDHGERYPQKSSRAKILIAFGQRIMLTAHALNLKEQGHEVTTSDNLVSALKALEDKEVFDLIITDLDTPGMDGLKLTAHARRTCPSAKIVAVADYLTRQMASEAVRAGADKTTQTVDLLSELHAERMI